MIGIWGWTGSAEPAEPNPAPAEAKPAAHAPERNPPANPLEAKPGTPPPAESVPSPKPEDPIVGAILATHPTTPLERVRAAEILAKLGRPDLAKNFLKQVLEAKLDEKQWADLGVDLGSVFFMRLASRQELGPEAGLLRDAVFTAMKARLENPQRLAELIGQLQDPSLEKRVRAMAGLREAHQAGAVALIQVLADPARKEEYSAVRAVLVQMGSDAVGPLLATLDAPEDRLKTEAAMLLGQLEAQEALLPLQALAVADNTTPQLRTAALEAIGRLGATPARGPREVAELLLRRAQEYYTGQRVIPADLESRVELWQWDHAKRKPVPLSLPAAEVRLRYAARWARQAHQLLPEEPRVRFLYLATMLEEAKYAQGLDKPLPVGENTPGGKAATFGLETLEAVLRLALESNHPVAATGVIEVMGRLNPSETILRRTSEPAVMVQALRHGDRRLRMAALGVILGMRPTSPFPGSTYVIEALEFFIGTQGTRRALVISAQSETCSALGGYLTSEGYTVDSARTGREALRLLLTSPDYELVLVDAGLRTPEPVVFLQQLRRDARTADLLVGVFSEQQDSERVQRTVAEDTRTVVFPRPYQADVAKEYFAQMLALAGPEWVPFDQRQRQAVQAMGWLADLAQDQKLYDLHGLEPTVQQALYVPGLGVPATKVLARLGTPTSQKALVDLVSRGTQPIELRQAAAEAFAQSVQQFGLLLTTAQIEHQYDRYNASKHEPAETQKVLSQILDVIELASPTSSQPTVKEQPQNEKPGK